MQYTLLINQSKSVEWGLNFQQAALFSFIYSVPSWANAVTQGDKTFYAISKQKIVEELPLLTDKPDTAYRILKVLQEKGLIFLSSAPKITLIQLTSKAKSWNTTELIKVGNKSDDVRINLRGDTENYPTNHSTSNQSTNINTDIANKAIEYLNSKVGRNYRISTANLELVTARLKDGATLADLKKVIDVKSAQWLNDKTMNQYLRPTTLFNRTKFEQYVAETPNKSRDDEFGMML